MKKILAVMLAFVFCLGIFAGCGKKDNGDDNPPDKEVYVPTEDEQTKALSIVLSFGNLTGLPVIVTTPLIIKAF